MKYPILLAALGLFFLAVACDDAESGGPSTPVADLSCLPESLQEVYGGDVLFEVVGADGIQPGTAKVEPVGAAEQGIITGFIGPAEVVTFQMVWEEGHLTDIDPVVGMTGFPLEAICQNGQIHVGEFTIDVDEYCQTRDQTDVWDSVIDRINEEGLPDPCDPATPVS